MSPVLGRRALNRALLARQLLLRRHELSAVAAVEHLAGLQAQAPNPPYVGLWTRLAGFDPDELSAAVVDREVVRIALLRSTIHLVSARDCVAWRPLVQPVLERGLRGNYAARLADLDFGEVAAAGRALVDERPRTFQELGELLGQRWPGHEPAALSALVRTRVPLVQVPPRGLWGRSGPAAHTSVSAWLGDLVVEPVVEDLVLRYLGAFGPASVRDVQVWSGLTRLRPVLDGLRARLLVFRDEQGVELFDLPDAPRPDEDAPAPVRLLGEFDNTLLSYADRTRIVAESDRARLFTVNGIIPGAFLVDGFVHGSWRVTRTRGRADLLVTPYRALARADRAAVADEAARLLEFAAAGDVVGGVEFAPVS